MGVVIVAGWVGEEVDGGGRVVIKPKEDVKRVGDGVRLGEEGRLLTFEIMSLSAVAARDGFGPFDPFILSRSTHFFFIGLSSLYSLSTSFLPLFKEENPSGGISSNSLFLFLLLELLQDLLLFCLRLIVLLLLLPLLFFLMIPFWELEAAAGPAFPAPTSPLFVLAMGPPAQEEGLGIFVPS